MESIETAIFKCCREWVGPAVWFAVAGRCGLCGERPTYLKPDPLSPLPVRPPIRS